jgi:hypothetical protein
VELGPRTREQTLSLPSERKGKFVVFRNTCDFLAVLAFCLPAGALAATPVIGSGNTAVIEPPLAHPAETPCVVTLFPSTVFGGNSVALNYAPPPACPGPWAKVIFSAQIGLDKGIQYDRTGTVFLGGVNVWFGTTSEPSPGIAPRWRVERDVTDDTAMLLGAQTGAATITNYTNSTDTSVITANAQLLFYPATAKDPVPTVPDMVIGLNPSGSTVALGNSAAQLSLPLNLPKNVAAARLDLFTQSQSNDEFWYTCVPDSLTSALESCGGGAFREGEVAVDGMPAGVAPVYPWIYTGGIDPFLWAPMPGVQTLDFKPFPVVLTPFAGLLSNGAAHTVSVSVFGADSYFSVAGNLYVYLDHGSATVTGGLLQDTLVATPKPVTTTSTGASGSNTRTAVKISNARDFTISGYAVTSAGRVTTTVHETSRFSNDQVFLLGNTLYNQQIKQDTETLLDIKQVVGAASSETVTQYSYPLTVSYVDVVAASGANRVTTGIGQTYHTNSIVYANGLPTGDYDFVNAITPVDTLLISAAGALTGNKNQSSTEVYTTQGTGVGCYSHTFAAAANVLTADTTTTTCK